MAAPVYNILPVENPEIDHAGMLFPEVRWYSVSSPEESAESRVWAGRQFYAQSLFKTTIKAYVPYVRFHFFI